MRLSDILKSCSLSLLCLTLIVDHSMATHVSPVDERVTQHVAAGQSPTPPADRENDQHCGAGQVPKPQAGGGDYAELLPREILLQVFLQLEGLNDVVNLRLVCKKWLKVSDDDTIWKKLYENMLLLPLSVEADSKLTYKDRVLEHFLLMKMTIAILEGNPGAFSGLLETYGKSEFCRMKYLELEFSLQTNQVKELLVNCGNIQAMKIRSRILHGKHTYEKDSQEAEDLIDKIIAQSNQDAIRRRIEGLARGEYGSAENTLKAKEFNFNELSIAQVDQKAIIIKIEGLARGEYGYAKDLNAAVALLKKHRCHLFKLAREE